MQPPKGDREYLACTVERGLLQELDLAEILAEREEIERFLGSGAAFRELAR